MRTGRPITNRSNYFSQHHYGTLIMLAKQVIDHMRTYGQACNLDINELVNVGWLSQARYYPDMRKCMINTKKKMFKFAYEEIRKVLPSFEGDWGKVIKLF